MIQGTLFEITTKGQAPKVDYILFKFQIIGFTSFLNDEKSFKGKLHIKMKFADWFLTKLLFKKPGIFWW